MLSQARDPYIREPASAGDPETGTAELIVRSLRLLCLPLLGLLAGCGTVVLNPSGDIAVQQRNLILASTGLMLLIIVPVILATALFAWRYRASNTAAAYAPDWHHSTQLEVLIWTAPLLIIIALGALTWISTHVLDPFRVVGRIDPRHEVALGTAPLTVDVVALDWKWLFIYPEQGIAAVNELAAPLNRPISFHITSGTVMNTFFVPALAGQIYAMAGMETKLGAVINKAGTYDGFSGNYSGAGFSDMRFKFHGMEQKDFDAWIANAKGASETLDEKRFMALEKPSEGVRPMFFGSVTPEIFEKILNMCVDPGKMCLDRMMAIDAVGGVPGKAGEDNREKLLYDGARTGEGNEAPGATFPATGRPAHGSTAPNGMNPTSLTPDVNGQVLKPDGNASGGAMPDMPGMSASPAPGPSPPPEPGAVPKQLNEH